MSEISNKENDTWKAIIKYKQEDKPSKEAFEYGKQILVDEMHLWTLEEYQEQFKRLYGIQPKPTNTTEVTGIVSAVSRNGIKIQNQWYDGDPGQAKKGQTVNMVVTPWKKNEKKGFDFISFELISNPSLAPEPSKPTPMSSSQKDRDLIRYAQAAALDVKVMSYESYVKRVCTRNEKLTALWTMERLQRMCKKLWNSVKLEEF